MKTPPRRGLAAFTLIEMMTVITIIIILASIVIGSMAYVKDRQAKEKAKIQLGLLAKALEDYKQDNGTYPPTSDGDGSGNSDELFNALYFVGAQDATGAKKIYITELNPTSNKQGWTIGTASASTRITDPWGYEYRYRTATNAGGTANTQTQNPDFDLWSVGKDGETKPESPSDKVNRDDLKNF